MGRLVAFLVIAAGIGWGVSRALAPLDFGIDRRVFDDAGRAARPVETVVRRIAPTPATPPPNLVVILADDLGWGDLGVQGSRALATPHLDRLAAEGMRFTQAYASAPVCSPSRAGLLTGRHPLRSGITTAMEAAGDSFLRRASRRAATAFAKLAAVDLSGGGNAVRGLPTSEVTLPEALAVAGYRSMAIGKWHLGDFTAWPEYHPARHGFDRFVGFNMSNDDWPVAFWRDGEEIVEDIALDQERYTALFTDEAVRFIEATGEAPFFLYLAHKDPHQPFIPGAPFAGRSAAGPYGDAVEELDWSVGEVVAALRRSGQARRTLVVFTSDNGPWFEGDPGGLRGRKGQSYEGGFRVPFIAWWPGRVPAGVVSELPVTNLDLLPTFLALGGLAPPSDRVIDGADLAAVLAGAAPDAALTERPLYFSHDYDVEAVRAGRWKYVERNSHYTWPAPLDKQDTLGGVLLASRDYRPPGADRAIPTLGSWPALYDLRADPAEAYDVSDRHPEVRERLAASLSRWRSALHADPRGWSEP